MTNITGKREASLSPDSAEPKSVLNRTPFAGTHRVHRRCLQSRRIIRPVPSETNWTCKSFPPFRWQPSSCDSSLFRGPSLHARSRCSLSHATKKWPRNLTSDCCSNVSNQGCRIRRMRSQCRCEALAVVPPIQGPTLEDLGTNPIVRPVIPSHSSH